MRFLVAALILVGLIACKQNGTSTGNPMKPTSGGLPLPSEATFADSLAVTACQLTANCHSQANLQDCTQRIYQFTTFAEKLNIFEQPTPTLARIKELERNALLVVQIDSARTCVDQIRAISCESRAARDAHRPELPEPYTGIVDLLGPVCQKVYSSFTKTFSEEL